MRKIKFSLKAFTLKTLFISQNKTLLYN